MHSDQFKDLDRFDLLGVGLIEVFRDAAFGRLLLGVVFGSLSLLAAMWLVAGALR